MEKSIFILGSCVSRDAIELFSDGEIQLVSYLARTSFASQASPSIEKFPHYANFKSNFQKRMVESDLRKKLHNELRVKDFELIIVDFIDDRFDLVEYENVGLATRSVEFMSVCEPNSITNRISHHGDVYNVLWKLGFNRFLKELKESGSLHKLRINKAFWANRNQSGQSLSKFSNSVIEKENAYLNSRYGYAESLLDKINFFTFNSQDFVADSNHKWGESPFHYTSDYYTKMTDMIRNDPQFS
ncbi:DUF6270 domain-containing protein [Salinimonas iocasae]|uniref:Uncharacterized protein n=1 Tax=Salinimonas iocasae TaxID=2572577 RepID=A0A5B7YCS5_9ALTE|nr:DUF6270 domain-containing protein [Salinimonas iocasae]QCZ92409.1 hypothetical protein FBQ74_02455 [Salinimonas iocasae]